MCQYVGGPWDGEPAAQDGGDIHVKCYDGNPKRWFYRLGEDSNFRLVQASASLNEGLKAMGLTLGEKIP